MSSEVGVLLQKSQVLTKRIGLLCGLTMSCSLLRGIGIFSPDSSSEGQLSTQQYFWKQKQLRIVSPKVHPASIHSSGISWIMSKGTLLPWVYSWRSLIASGKYLLMQLLGKETTETILKDTVSRKVFVPPLSLPSNQFHKQRPKELCLYSQLSVLPSILPLVSFYNFSAIHTKDWGLQERKIRWASD